MKNVVLVLLALGVAALAFAGGSGEDSSGTSPDIVTAPGEFPIVSEPWTMSVMWPQDSLVEDMETNKFTVYMEDLTGIHVDWQEIPATNVQEKVNLVLASGSDLPDVLLNTRLSNDAMVQYGSQGLLVPLQDYIDSQSTEFVKVLELPQFATFRAQMTDPEGNIWYLPKISECYQCEFGQRLYINKAWLDTLGLDVPTTTQELYDVLVAFKTQDPNGNGRADEVPFVGAITGWHTEVDAQIMSSFIYNDGRRQNRMVVRDGRVDVVYDKPEWREGLRYMNRLVEEGLLDPVSFTQDGSQLIQLGSATDDLLVGVFTGGTLNSISPPNDPMQNNYITLPPLQGPDGFVTTGYFPTAPQTGLFMITSAAEHPVAAFRWADWMYNEEPSLFMRFGEEGVDWVRAEPGELDPFGEQAFLRPILPWGAVQNAHWTFDQPGYSSRAHQVGQVVVAGQEDTTNNRFIRDTPIYEAVAPPLEEVLPNLFFTVDELDEIQDIKAALTDYVEETIARFATGDLDIERDWDDYLAELDAIGLDKLIEVTQAVYDRQYGN